MKRIYLTLIVLWTTYALIEWGDLKPSDDIYLFLLCASSILFSAVGIIIESFEIAETKKNRQK